MVDVVHMRLMAVEEALRSVLEAPNRGKDRKSAEAVATMVLDENMAYGDAVLALAEREDAPEPEEVAEEPAEEPEEVEDKPKARARAKA